jgi:hypothetical protein
VKYRLSIVEVDKENLRMIVKEICVVGTFNSETDLEIWARENAGELKRCE